MTTNICKLISRAGLIGKRPVNGLGLILQLLVGLARDSSMR